jgi:hypothetical protein
LIPDIVSFDVGENVVSWERAFDTGLVAVFADRGALERYNQHPEHQRVAAIGPEISQQTVSVDFIKTHNAPAEP